MVVEAGPSASTPSCCEPSELLKAPGRFDYLDVGGPWRSLALPEESLAFTLCQVPVLYRPASAPHLAVTRSDGTCLRCRGQRRSVPSLPGRSSTARGEVRHIEAWIAVPVRTPDSGEEPMNTTTRSCA